MSSPVYPYIDIIIPYRLGLHSSLSKVVSPSNCVNNPLILPLTFLSYSLVTRQWRNTLSPLRSSNCHSLCFWSLRFSFLMVNKLLDCNIGNNNPYISVKSRHSLSYSRRFKGRSASIRVSQSEKVGHLSNTKHADEQADNGSCFFRLDDGNCIE